MENEIKSFEEFMTESFGKWWQENFDSNSLMLARFCYDGGKIETIRHAVKYIDNGYRVKDS